jgi:hypothetical protein
MCGRQRRSKQRGAQAEHADQLALLGARVPARGLPADVLEVSRSTCNALMSLLQPRVRRAYIRTPAATAEPSCRRKTEDAETL